MVSDQIKVALNSIQLPICTIHFEIAKFNWRVLVTTNILLIQSVEQKEKNKFFGDKSCKIRLTLGTWSFIFLQFEWIIKTSLKLWLVVLFVLLYTSNFLPSKLVITLNTLISVCIFCKLFSLQFLRCWQGEFV